MFRTNGSFWGQKWLHPTRRTFESQAHAHTWAPVMHTNYLERKCFLAYPRPSCIPDTTSWARSRNWASILSAGTPCHLLAPGYRELLCWGYPRAQEKLSITTLTLRGLSGAGMAWRPQKASSPLGAQPTSCLAEPLAEDPLPAPSRLPSVVHLRSPALTGWLSSSFRYILYWLRNIKGAVSLHILFLRGEKQPLALLTWQMLTLVMKNAQTLGNFWWIGNREEGPRMERINFFSMPPSQGCEVPVSGHPDLQTGPNPRRGPSQGD